MEPRKFSIELQRHKVYPTEVIHATPGWRLMQIPPRVLLTDFANNPVAGVQVAFGPASGGGVVTGAVVTTGADGAAVVESWVLGALGAQQLEARVEGVSGSPVLFEATALHSNLPASSRCVRRSGHLRRSSSSTPMEHRSRSMGSR